MISETVVEVSVRKELCELITVEGEVSVLDYEVLIEGFALALDIDISTYS